MTPSTNDLAMITQILQSQSRRITQTARTTDRMSSDLAAFREELRLIRRALESLKENNPHD
ncbi:hypothetical protein GCM10009755_29010 [Brevibacterium samyangense]|uniref:Uncharacterized protein n=1 Tax=Brevibacterium samyangense TaxID=366888 RepID=A0ABP5F3V6_9MICO